MQYEFGTGVLFGKKIGVTAPTPVRFGALQGASVDIAFTVKELYGQNQFPLAIGRGTAKITGKAQFGQFNAQVFNDLFFGETTLGTGSVVTEINEAKTVTANAATATHNTTYLRDLGMIYAANGVPLSRVANSPLVAQYTVNESTGVYAFNATDNAANVKINYQWTDSSNGKTVTITNQLLGSSPQFMVVLSQTFQNKKLSLTLNACMSSQLTLATKLEDFTIPDFSFQAFADSADELGKLSTDE